MLNEPAFAETVLMLRTVFAVGTMAILGIVALKLMFGVFGVLVGILFALFFLALKIALFGLLVYLVIRVLSPDTAQKIRERWRAAA
jgi:hypothetical protein